MSHGQVTWYEMDMVIHPMSSESSSWVLKKKIPTKIDHDDHHPGPSDMPIWKIRMIFIVPI
jgi:hypothetical protein